MHPDPAPRPSLRNRLLADHRRFEGILERVAVACEANDWGRIQSLWSNFESSLLAHLDAEEKFLIPALIRSRQRDARTILAEHRHIRLRVAELRTGVALQTVRADAARAFVEELRAHSRHEDLVYESTESQLSDADRASLFDALLSSLQE